MGGGLALSLHSGDFSYFPLVIAGSLLACLGIVLADLQGFSHTPA